MKFYADTSFLYSYYSADANSPRADLWRQANAVSLPFTPLHHLELRNAIELAVFQKRARAAEAAAVWKTVESDVAGGIMVEVPLSLLDLYAKAQEFAANHTALDRCAQSGHSPCRGGKFLWCPGDRNV